MVCGDTCAYTVCTWLEVSVGNASIAPGVPGEREVDAVFWCCWGGGTGIINRAFVDPWEVVAGRNDIAPAPVCSGSDEESMSKSGF